MPNYQDSNAPQSTKKSGVVSTVEGEVIIRETWDRHPPSASSRPKRQHHRQPRPRAVQTVQEILREQEVELRDFPKQGSDGIKNGGNCE